ncbi:MAG: hypothetical protein V4544_03735 [Pseudomonadota bacterium]
MESYNNKTISKNKLTHYSKIIIGCVFIVACITSSASAMRKGLVLLEEAARLGAHNVSISPNNLLQFEESLAAFEKSTTDWRAKNLITLREHGVLLFENTAILRNDRENIIADKTQTINSLLQIHNQKLKFINSQIIINVFNNSVNNASSYAHIEEYLKSFVQGIPGELRIGLNDLEPSLAKLEGKISDTALKSMSAKLKWNYSRKLIGIDMGIC